MTWAQAVKSRDNYKCISCGATENLEAHHIVEKYINPSLKQSVNNGVTLCRKRHRTIHKGSFNPKGCALKPIESDYKQVQNAIEEHFHRNVINQ